jgi:nitrogen fixation protein NifB
MIKHPCFDGHENSNLYGRIHIPLVAKCNIKCSYCNRKNICFHENRPGISNKVVTVDEGISIIENLKETNLKIIGIAGPGDPLAEPDKLLSFIEKIRKKFDDNYELCISTNGLNLYKYIDDLCNLNVNYITITINSINEGTLSDLLEWVNIDGIYYKGIEASKIMIESQERSLKSIVNVGINCKVNTVVVPDVNQFEITTLLKRLKEIGVNKSNLIPLIPVKGTKFENTYTISVNEFNQLVNEADNILDQVKGCKKCRADAVYVKCLPVV